MGVSKVVAALSVAGALSLGVSAPAYSAPITPLSAAAKPAAQADNAVQVRFGGFHGGFGGFHGGGFGGWRGGGWHGGGWHRGVGFGVGALAAGAIIGSALAAPYYYGGDYGYDDAYYGGGYGYPYGYRTVVVTPGYGYYGGYPYGGYYGAGW
jgi:hypothetical protein